MGLDIFTNYRYTTKDEPRKNSIEWACMYTVYVLRSVSQPNRYYVGQTNNLAKRVLAHNNKKVTSTSRYAPW